MKQNSNSHRDPFDFEKFHPQIDALHTNQEQSTQAPPQTPPPRNPATRKFLRNLFITLMITGVALGGLLSWGIAKLMDKAGLLDVPSQEQTK